MFGNIRAFDVRVYDPDAPVQRDPAPSINASIEALIRECHERGQPTLVGTTSIEKSEVLSEHLKKLKIDHQVLNARHHEQEAYIIAQAGVPGAVTIATNMAGRGTDIQLGGNVEMRVMEELAKIEDEVAANLDLLADVNEKWWPAQIFEFMQGDYEEPLRDLREQASNLRRETLISALEHGEDGSDADVHVDVRAAIG